MASSPACALGHQAPPAAPVALPADLPAHLAATVVAGVAAGDAVRTSSLVTALAAVPDPRHRRGRRHELTGVLAIGACACLTGARSYVAIGEWAAAQGRAVLHCLGSAAELPSESTVRRCLQTTDPAAVEAAVAGWAGQQLAAQQARAADSAGAVLVNADRRVIAIDGKTLRGSAPRSTPEQAAAAGRGGGRTHLVAGYDHTSGVTLGQVACSPEAGTGGEVAAARTLLAALDERGLLAGAVITVDAGFTARELAVDLRTRGAHWILRIKGNQKRLHTRLKALPWAQVPEAGRVHSVGHGRVETRTIAGDRPGRQHRRARRVLPRRPPSTQDRPPAARPAWALECADRLRDHQPRRPRRRPGAAGDLGPRALGHRGRPALGPRHGLRRGPQPDPHRPRPDQPRRAAHPGDQRPPADRPHEHRRRPATTRPNTAATAGHPRAHVTTLPRPWGSPDGCDRRPKVIARNRMFEEPSGSWFQAQRAPRRPMRPHGESGPGCVIEDTDVLDRH